MLKMKMGTTIVPNVQYQADCTFNLETGKPNSDSRVIFVRETTVDIYNKLRDLLQTKPAVDIMSERDDVLISLGTVQPKSLSIQLADNGTVEIIIGLV